FLDDRIGPDGLHQPLFVEDRVAVFDEAKKGVENPWRQRNLGADIPQEKPRCVQAEFVELVKLRGHGLSGWVHKILERFICPLRTFRPGVTKADARNRGISTDRNTVATPARTTNSKPG